MSTTSAPEPRPTLLDPETTARLQREEGVIKSLAITSIAFGHTEVEVLLHAIEMADELREYHQVITKNARSAGSRAGETFHQNRTDDAEQLRLWFVNLLDQAITQQSVNSVNTVPPAIASIRFDIGTSAHGGVASYFHRHQAVSPSPVENVIDLHDAFKNAQARNA